MPWKRGGSSFSGGSSYKYNGVMCKKIKPSKAVFKFRGQKEPTKLCNFRRPVGLEEKKWKGNQMSG